MSAAKTLGELCSREAQKNGRDTSLDAVIVKLAEEQLELNKLLDEMDTLAPLGRNAHLVEIKKMILNFNIRKIKKRCAARQNAFVSLRKSGGQLV